MKKQLVVALMGGVLSACAPTATDDREAYRDCINQAAGVTQKVKACQPLLAVLHQKPQHRVFAQRESVRVLDYQRCLDAEKMGDGEVIHTRCQKLWQEIQQANH
ncbi:ChiQ/YbfN family lipoprotein [Erwiniaceae bacterium CAU 1747]